jgi:perosamine synthetase
MGHRGIDLIHPETANTVSTFWMFTLLLDQPARPIIDKLIAMGIQARPIWQLLPSLPAFREKAFSWKLEHAESVCRRGLSLPCSVGLEESSQDHVIEAVRSVVSM